MRPEFAERRRVLGVRIVEGHEIIGGLAALRLALDRTGNGAAPLIDIQPQYAARKCAVEALVAVGHAHLPDRQVEEAVRSEIDRAAIVVPVVVPALGDKGQGSCGDRSRIASGDRVAGQVIDLPIRVIFGEIDKGLTCTFAARGSKAGMQVEAKRTIFHFDIADPGSNIEQQGLVGTRRIIEAEQLAATGQHIDAARVTRGEFCIDRGFETDRPKRVDQRIAMITADVRRDPDIGDPIGKIPVGRELPRHDNRRHGKQQDGPGPRRAQ